MGEESALLWPSPKFQLKVLPAWLVLLKLTVLPLTLDVNMAAGAFSTVNTAGCELASG